MKIDQRGIKRFLKYSSVGFGTFVFDLCLLYILVEVFNLNYLFCAGAAFFVAISLNYVISRRLVFAETKKDFTSGYMHFLFIAFIGMAVTLLGMAVLVSTLGIHYLLARCIVGALVGAGNYLSNLYLNFRVVATK